MQIKNIEAGLQKTMVAVFKKNGLSEAAAIAKATQNLVAAKATFTEAQTKSIEKPAVSARERLVGQSRPAAPRAGASIRSSSSKVTSAEQVALRRVSAPAASNAILMAKTSASVAIALGSVATWARKLP